MMPRKGSCVYSVSELKRLWAAGKTHQQIAAALGCSEMYVSQLRQLHNLPFRRKKYYGPKEKDPTPEEIAERAAECRAKWQAAEPRGERYIVPRYTWDGCGFRGIV
jgi:hypothetical protein